MAAKKKARRPVAPSEAEVGTGGDIQFLGLTVQELDGSVMALTREIQALRLTMELLRRKVDKLLETSDG